MTATDHDNEPTVDQPRSSRLWWLVGGVFVVIVGALAAFSGGAEPGGTAPDGLDEFSFQTPSGDTVTLADFEGPLVLNYFAAWCGPCRAEMPDFEIVHQDLGDEVTIVGISRDTVTDSWLALVEDTGVTFPTIYEGAADGSFVALDGRAMPTTVFITADGTIAEIWGGPLTDDKLRELIAEHLT